MSAAAATARVYRLAELSEVLEAEHSTADAAIAAGRNLGPVIPFPRLREELGGCWPIGVTGMHAGPGAGKSAFAIQAILNAECPTVYVTYEMSAATVMRRMIACETGTFLAKLRPGEMPASGIQAATLALSQKYPNVTIVDATTAPCAPQMLRDVVAEARADAHHALTVIDSLHAMAASNDPTREEYQAVSAAIENLRRIAHEQRIAIVAIVERNRASMATGGISAGAASRKIEYSAEAIIELANVGNDDLTDADRVNLRFAKNRNGRAGVEIGYLFYGARQRFEETGPAWPVQSSRAAASGNANSNAKVKAPSVSENNVADEGYEDRNLFG